MEKIKMKDFTHEDWSCFAGCVTEDPKIAWLDWTGQELNFNSDVVLIADGPSASVYDDFNHERSWELILPNHEAAILVLESLDISKAAIPQLEKLGFSQV